MTSSRNNYPAGVTDADVDRSQGFASQSHGDEPTAERGSRPSLFTRVRLESIRQDMAAERGELGHNPITNANRAQTLQDYCDDATWTISSPNCNNDERRREVEKLMAACLRVLHNLGESN